MPVVTELVALVVTELLALVVTGLVAAGRLVAVERDVEEVEDGAGTSDATEAFDVLDVSAVVSLAHPPSSATATIAFRQRAGMCTVCPGCVSRCHRTPEGRARTGPGIADTVSP